MGIRVGKEKMPIHSWVAIKEKQQAEMIAKQREAAVSSNLGKFCQYAKFAGKMKSWLRRAREGQNSKSKCEETPGQSLPPRNRSDVWPAWFSEGSTIEIYCKKSKQWKPAVVHKKSQKLAKVQVDGQTRRNGNPKLSSLIPKLTVTNGSTHPKPGKQSIRENQ